MNLRFAVVIINIKLNNTFNVNIKIILKNYQYY